MKLNDIPTIPFSSPQKKIRPREEKPITERVTKIFNINLLKCNKVQKKGNYSIDAKKLFTAPNQTEKIDQHLKLIQEIVIKNKYKDNEILRLDKTCQNILASFNDEKSKLIELGTLYYYLSCNKPVPSSKNLFTARLQEMLQKISLMKVMHLEQLGDDSKRFPTGIPLYIKRSLMHTFFTNDGIFNLGGLLAVEALLHTQIVLEFDEETRNQMLSVVNELKDENFRSLFEKPFQVHENAEKFLRIDLNLTPDEPLYFTHVRLGIIAALFNAYAQDQEPNCTAVAFLLLVQNYGIPYCTKLLIEALKTGKLEFKNTHFPIKLLIGSDLREKEDSFWLLSLEQLKKYLSFIEAHCTYVEKEGSLLKDDKFHELFEGNKDDQFDGLFGGNANYARALYLSQQRNLFQTLLLRYFHCIAVNGRDNFKDSDRRVKHKNYFFTKLIGFIEDNSEDIENLGKFSKMCKEKFNFIDQKNRCYMSEGYIFFTANSQKLKQQQYYGDEFYKSCDYLRCMYFIEDDHYQAIDTISDFKKHLIQVLENFSDDTCFQFKETCKKEIESRSFINYISKFLKFYNDDTFKIQKGQEYLESDIFIFSGRARGGECKYLAMNACQELFQTWMHYQSESVKHWFNKTIRIIEKASRVIMTSSKEDQNILIVSEDHAFRLNLSWLNDYVTKKDFIEENVVKPAEALLNKELTQKEKENILKSANLLERYNVPQQVQSARNFKLHFCNRLNKAEQHDFCVALENELLTIQSEKIEAELPFILNSFSLQPKELKFVAEKLVTNCKLTPFKAARILQKALLKLNKPYFCSVVQLENLVRTAFGFPNLIYLGNLNYADIKEKLAYAYAAIGIDWSSETISFLTVRKGSSKRYKELDSLLVTTSLYCLKPHAFQNELHSIN